MYSFPECQPGRTQDDPVDPAVGQYAARDQHRFDTGTGWLPGARFGTCQRVKHIRSDDVGIGALRCVLAD